MRQTSALGFFSLSVLTIIGGATLAMRNFPESFDWTATVISALASQKHNPDGGMWFAGSLSLSLLFLLPVCTYLRTAGPNGRANELSARALRLGLFGGILLGIERMFIYHVSSVVFKAHEVLAVLTFLALYTGVVGLNLARIRNNPAFLWPALVVLGPIFAVGLSQLMLYLGQREFGFVGTDWSDPGIPAWMNFAFWQWLAAGLLWTGIGCLTLFTHPSRAPSMGTAKAASMATI